MCSLSRLARKSWLAATTLTFLCAAMLLPGLGTSTVARQQELRVLLAARDMAEGGSWLVPHFMGEERLRKPPLMYWIVATAFKIAGTTESETAARLPSAIAGTALVLATFFCGRKLIGRRAAFLGALVMLTSVGFIRHARLAETDIAQTLFCSLAIFSLHTALTKRSGTFVHFSLAGIFAGIGFMTKGPASVVMPLAAVATFLACGADRRSAFRKLGWRGPLASLLICAAIAVPWYIAVALQSSANTGSQAGNEIARLLSESAHKGPIVYYVWTLPARMGIWALALPVAIFGAWKKLRHHRGPRFLLCWLASSFAILSTLSSKQNHYALLLFLPSALLTGWLLARASRFTTLGKKRAENFQSLEKANQVSRILSRFAAAYLFWLCVLALAAGVLMFITDFVQNMRDMGNVVAPGLAAFGLAGVLFRRNRFIQIMALGCALAWTTAVYSLRIEPLLDGDRVVDEIITANSPTIHDAHDFYVAGPHSSLVAWLAHHPVTISTNSISEIWQSEIKAGDVLLWSSRGKSAGVVQRKLGPFKMNFANTVTDSPDELLAKGIQPVDRRSVQKISTYIFRKPDEAKP